MTQYLFTDFISDTPIPYTKKPPSLKLQEQRLEHLEQFVEEFKAYVERKVTRQKPTHKTHLLSTVLSKRDEVLAIAGEFGASNVRVVGSVARDEDTNLSDLDLLVDMPDTRGRIMMRAELFVLFGVMVDVFANEKAKGVEIRL